ncbi:hypothetical protein HDK64DRAFT_255912 [Phyllosticta capitalensis]|uniref:BTB domain-containing protein n=1 Tax=Phyllosticta capitalensis TaxID=121624 RepID=A0ABR1YIP2_9PEZI
MTTEIDVTRLWQTGQLSDVQVQLRDRTFKAHKIMLCKHSSMFRRIIERNPATDKINLKLDEAAIFPDGEIFAVFLESIHTQRFDRDRGYSLLGNIIFALQAYQAGQKSGSPLLTGAAATNFKMLLFHSERDDFGNAATGDAFARFIQMVYNRSTITSACIHPARDECGLRKYFMEFYSPRMSKWTGSPGGFRISQSTTLSPTDRRVGEQRPSRVRPLRMRASLRVRPVASTSAHSSSAYRANAAMPVTTAETAAKTATKRERTACHSP